MICSVPYEIIKRYPNRLFAIFVTSTEYNTTTGQTDGHIANNLDGYIIEMEKAGQSGTNIGSHTLQASPYPDWLRPITNLEHIYKKNIFLESVEYFAYDTTLTGSSYQDANILTEIYNSKTGNDAYMQNLYRNGLIPNFQPNYFRPQFYINSENVFKGITESNFGNKNNKGDMSIGLPLNHSFDFMKEFKKVSEIKAYGQVAQKVTYSGSSYYQRYFLYCVASIWYE